MSLSYFVQQLLNGLSLGGAYALIAIGYTMVYGILRMINFAHGDEFMMAGYFMIYSIAVMPWFLSIPVVILLTILMSVLIERAAYKPLRSAPRMSVMISAIGVSYLLENLAADSDSEEGVQLRRCLRIPCHTAGADSYHSSCLGTHHNC